MKPSQKIIDYIENSLMPWIHKQNDLTFQSIKSFVQKELTKTDKFILHQIEINRELIKQVRDLIEESK